jgi:hypothetical protein
MSSTKLYDAIAWNDIKLPEGKFSHGTAYIILTLSICHQTIFSMSQGKCVQSNPSELKPLNV